MDGEHLTGHLHSVPIIPSLLFMMSTYIYSLENVRQLEVICLKETKKMSLISSKSGNK